MKDFFIIWAIVLGLMTNYQLFQLEKRVAHLEIRLYGTIEEAAKDNLPTK